MEGTPPEKSMAQRAKDDNPEKQVKGKESLEGESQGEVIVTH